MKKLLALGVCLCACMATSYAQKGPASWGLNLNYGNKTHVGIGAKYRYQFSDNWRVEPAFDYYFKHDCVSFWDLGANIHYLIPVAEQTAIYPLGGLSYLHGKAHFSEFGDEWNNVGDGNLAAKLGVGADFRISPNTTINVEAKYQLVDSDSQLMISAGINFVF